MEVLGGFTSWSQGSYVTLFIFFLFFCGQSRIIQVQIT